MDGCEPSRRRAVPWGFLGMVALVALVESTEAGHRDDLAGRAGAQADFVGRSTRTEVAGRGLLCFGDSVVKFGVIPRLIEEKAGLAAYNLAASGQPASVSYMMFRRALEAGARPKAVIVDFKPLLQGGYRLDVPVLSRMAGLRDAFGLAWLAGDGALFGEFATAWALPTARDRQAIRSAILRSLLALPDAERPLCDALRRNWAMNQGAEILPPLPPNLAPAEFYNEAINLRQDWSCHPVNARYIDAFFRLAGEHGIPAYWLLTPIHPRLQAARDRMGIDATLTRFVHERLDASRRGASVTVVDARRLGLDPDLYVDATHLDRRGAVALSTALGEFLADRDRDRAASWVVLSPRSRPLDDVRIEDSGQSALAVRAGADSLRR